MQTRIKELRRILPKIGKRNTSYYPELWSELNPLWGHCAVVSLLAQDELGGKILRIEIEDWSGERQHHFFNQLPSGRLLDLTVAQFGGRKWKRISNPVVIKRSKLLRSKNTKRRYKLLKRRFINIKFNGTTLADWLPKS